MLRWTVVLLWLQITQAFAPFASQRTSFGSCLWGIATSEEVDLNQYNLPFEQAVEEWTANIRPETMLIDSGVSLGAKSNKEVMVGTDIVTFPRKPDCGLGIMLEEIAGGREDGLGITIVTGLVEGGLAEGSGILKGDCIAGIAVKKRTQMEEGKAEWDTVESVSTECLGYDATVDAILGLPPPSDDEQEVFVLTMKRLRRKPRVRLTIQYPPSQEEDSVVLELFSGENLRRAMLSRGVKLNDPLARRFDNGGEGNCGAEGTCATCVVSVSRGGELLNPAGLQEKQMLQDTPRWRLGCRAVVGYGGREGELVLRVNPKQW